MVHCSTCSFKSFPLVLSFCFADLNNVLNFRYAIMEIGLPHLEKKIEICAWEPPTLEEMVCTVAIEFIDEALFE